MEGLEGIRFFMFLSGFSTILILFFIGFFLSNYSRKEIVFGVRIPTEFAEDTEVKGIKKMYKKRYAIIGGIVSVLSGYLIYRYPLSVRILTAVILLMAGIMYIPYYESYKRIKKLKADRNFVKQKREIVIVDTTFRRENNKKVLASPLWFMIPLGIAIINIIMGLAVYPKLPNVIPMHFNASGMPNRWAEKSIFNIMILPLTQLGMLIFMYPMYKIIGRAKQQINSQRIKISKEQDRLFRVRWSGYIIFLTTIIMIVFTIINLAVLGIGGIDTKEMTNYTLIISLIIPFTVIPMILWTGQGGSRIKVKGENEEYEGYGEYMDRNDDSYWKLGLFYYNPEDPSLIVEARVGAGFDVNYGRPLGMFIGAILPMAAIIITMIFVP